MSEEKKGIKELKEAVEFIGEFVTSIDKSRADGKVDVQDIGNFLPAMMLAPNAFAGLDELKLEAKDLDEVELVELKAAFAAKFDLVDDKAELLFEEAMTVILSVYGMVQKVKAYKEAK